MFTKAILVLALYYGGVTMQTVEVANMEQCETLKKQWIAQGNRGAWCLNKYPEKN